LLKPNVKTRQRPPHRRIVFRAGLIRHGVVLFCGAILWTCFSACASNAPTRYNPRSEAPRGFFDSLADQLTERECNVARFTCPYGFGPAGEPCECTDPRGIVRAGRTIK
jgi:hypothetical protein